MLLSALGADGCVLFLPLFFFNGEINVFTETQTAFFLSRCSWLGNCSGMGNYLMADCVDFFIERQKSPRRDGYSATYDGMMVSYDKELWYDGC